jgi:hypothetical protein
MSVCVCACAQPAVSYYPAADFIPQCGQMPGLEGLAVCAPNEVTHDMTARHSPIRMHDTWGVWSHLGVYIVRRSHGLDGLAVWLLHCDRRTCPRGWILLTHISARG